MANTDSECDDVLREFKEAVNMTAAQLQKHLDSGESKAVGFKREGETESVGHDMGGHIIELIGKKRDDLNDDDIAHMKKVVGYVHRHLKQKPEKEEIETSRWRTSLMNWGRDPQKDR